mgnify:FL=1
MIKYPIYVTLDTNILDAANFDFNEKSTLQLLVNYVKKGKVKVVLSNIVVKEAEKHIAKRGVCVCSLMRKLRADALKTATDYQIKQLGLGHILELSTDKAEISQKSIDLLHKYIADLDAEILDTSKIDLDAIIDDYFEIRAPFQIGEKKRKEFPDAFIANQIRERFGHEEMVAIISIDKGFKEACQSWDNHLFFSSLGDLYGEMNKQEEFYAATKDFVIEQKSDIESYLAQYIKNNVEINVIGLSYDRKGVTEGYDYSETYLNSLSDVTIGIHSVDEIDDNKSIVTLKCKSSFSMDCFYEDYENALWDSEEKEYVYVDTIEIREEHKAKFACRIEINRTENTFEVLPFKIILGADSRKERYEIETDSEYDYEQEIEDMNRESVGLNPLGDYETYLEEDLVDSKMSKDIIERFNCINELYKEYEEILSIYDSLLKLFLDKENIKSIIRIISSKLEEIADFPGIIDGDDISQEEISEIEKWVEFKYEDASRKMNIANLPDSIEYGDNIEILGVDDQKLFLKIDEININPSAGDKEWVDISLSDEKEIIASGIVELTIGYIEYDEDGGIADGLTDEIDYNYHSIIEQLDDFILEQNEYMKTEKRIFEFLEETIE